MFLSSRHATNPIPSKEGGKEREDPKLEDGIFVFNSSLAYPIRHPYPASSETPLWLLDRPGSDMAS